MGRAANEFPGMRIIQVSSNGRGLAVDGYRPRGPVQAEAATEISYATQVLDEALLRFFDDTGLDVDNTWFDRRNSLSTGSTHGKKLSKSMRNFARWAFGPRGLLSLEMIAVGDFSYRERYALYQVVLVRNNRQGDGSHSGKENFRRMLRTDEQHVFMDDYEHVLAACPASYLFEDD